VQPFKLGDRVAVTYATPLSSGGAQPSSWFEGTCEKVDLRCAPPPTQPPPAPARALLAAPRAERRGSPGAAVRPGPARWVLWQRRAGTACDGTGHARRAHPLSWLRARLHAGAAAARGSGMRAPGLKRAAARRPGTPL